MSAVNIPCPKGRNACDGRFSSEVTRRLKDLLHGESLVPTVTITFVRHAMDLAAGKSRVELSLDEGIIESGDRSQSLREVEFELKEGDPAALFELVSHLAGEIPLYPEDRSKLERAFSFLQERHPKSPATMLLKCPRPLQMLRVSLGKSFMT